MKRRTRLAAAAVIAVGTTLLPHEAHAQECHPVAIVTATLTDDGDNDGFADTRETVALRLELLNPGPTDLTGLIAEMAVPVTTGAPNVCISGPQVTFGHLDAGEQRTATQPFVLHVSDIDRIDPFEDLSSTFEIRMTADQGDVCVRGELTLDLDLDASGGGAPTVWNEGFEFGLGSFENLNLDEGIPGDNQPEGLVYSEGYRCQYSDPDWRNSGSYGSDYATDCFPGNNLAHAQAVFWQIDGESVVESPDGGRAYTGTHSLHYGIYHPYDGFTTPMGTIDGAGTIDPINLGAENPELSIFHQVSLMDDRGLGSIPPLRSADRGVVQLQLADSAGDAVGDWIRLEPFRNVYDQQAVDNYYNCMFDPIDDGTTEDDFFDPTDPDRRLGPSSTCYPQFTYANLGDTDSPFIPANVGNGDGPGLAGSLGVGTWVESAFDLSRFRARRVRLRFVVTSIKADHEDWNGMWWHGPVDDGWWIDDVTVTGSLTDAATVTVDTKDNSGLPGPPGGDADHDGVVDVCDNCPAAFNTSQEDADLDGIGDACDPCPLDATNVGEDVDDDGYCSLDNCPEIYNPDQYNADETPAGAVCDCDDDNERVYPGAPEWNDGIDNQCPGDAGHGLVDEISGAGFHSEADKFLFSWTPHESPGPVTYQLAESRRPAFAPACPLIPYEGEDPFFVLDQAIFPGQIRFYLVRSWVPNTGTWGQSSSGADRTVACAP